ncbi:C13 family peptidase [Thermodesulfobacteriota bacterium]
MNRIFHLVLIASIIGVTPVLADTTYWDTDHVLGQNGPYEFAGIYEFDNLTISDNVEVTSSGISQLVLNVKGTLILGANVIIRVRNGYYPEAPQNPIGLLETVNFNDLGIDAGGFLVFPNVFGKGGDGGKGGDTPAWTSGIYGPAGGGGGGFGGGKGGAGGNLNFDNASVQKGKSGSENGGDGGNGEGWWLVQGAGLGGKGGGSNDLGRQGENGAQNTTSYKINNIPLTNIGPGGGGGNGGAGRFYAIVGSGGGGGYGGGVLTIAAKKIVYDLNHPPKFLVSGQKGAGGENGEGGLLIIRSWEYNSDPLHWNLNTEIYGEHIVPSTNGGHGIQTGNPQKVFINPPAPCITRKLCRGSNLSLSAAEILLNDTELTSYEWCQEKGTPLVLSDTNAASVLFNAPSTGPPIEDFILRIIGIDTTGNYHTGYAIVFVMDCVDDGVDSDQDGLSNSYEETSGKDALAADTDLDGFPDITDPYLNYLYGITMFTLTRNSYPLVLNGAERKALAGEAYFSPVEFSYQIDDESMERGMTIDEKGIINWETATEGDYPVKLKIFSDNWIVIKEMNISVTNPVPEFEQNNTFQEAQEIDLDQSYLGFVGIAGDVDYYNLFVDSAAIYRFDMRPENQIGSDLVKFEIIDSSERVYAERTSSAGLEIVLDAGLMPGNYFVRLTHISGFDGAFNYGLKGYPVAGYTPQTSAQGIILGEDHDGTIINLNQVDKYQISFNERHYVRLQFTVNNFDFQPTLTITSAEQNDFQDMVYNPIIPLDESFFLPVGDYTVTVEREVSSIGPLEYSIQLQELGVAEIEPNDNENNASLLDINPESGMSILWAQFLTDNDVDYYEIQIPKPMSIDIDLHHLDDKGYTMELIFSGETIYSNNDSSVTTALYPGKFFLKVSGGSGMYSLDAHEMSEQREYEPNDGLAFSNILQNQNQIQASLYSQNDTDFFAFYQKQDGWFNLIVNTNNMITVKIIDASGKTFYEDIIGSDTIFLGLKKGNYYINLSANGPRSYSLFADGDIEPLNRLIRVLIKGSSSKLEIGEKLSLHFIGYYADGSEIDHTSDAEWTLSEGGEEIVDLDQNGNVKALSQGTVTIYGQYAGKAVQFPINISLETEPIQHHGNLILVAGGGIADTNTLKDSTQYLSDLVYRRFASRLFTDEDIFYFNPMPWHDINGDGYDNDVVDDVSPTVIEVGQAITDWAAEQNTDGPLYIYLIDHGGIDTFKIFPSEILTAVHLKGYIDTFQAATNRQVIVMIEACKSGSFTDDLVSAGNDRMVITCTDDQDAYLQLAGRISFTQFFVDRLLTGDSIYQAWLKAKGQLGSMGIPYKWMKPQLSEGISMTSAQTMIGGNFAIASLFPEIMDQSPSISIIANTIQNFYVQLSDLEEIKAVWAVVLPPDYVPPTTSQDLEAPEVALPSFDLTDADKDGRYEGNYSDFIYNADYRITFYARNTNGNVTVSPATIVSVTDGEDLLIAPVLIDFGATPTNFKDVLLKWEAVSAAVKYTLQYTDNADFINAKTITGIFATQYTILSSELSQGTWYWRVKSMDDTGDESEFSEPSFFEVGYYKGDINLDGCINLTDALIVLQTMVGILPQGTVHTETEISGDDKIGLEELIFILQDISGLR